jgi:hypothetical protein
MCVQRYMCTHTEALAHSVPEGCSMYCRGTVYKGLTIFLLETNVSILSTWSMVPAPNCIHINILFFFTTQIHANLKSVVNHVKCILNSKNKNSMHKHTFARPNIYSFVVCRKWGVDKMKCMHPQALRSMHPTHFMWYGKMAAFSLPNTPCLSLLLGQCCLSPPGHCFISNDAANLTSSWRRRFAIRCRGCGWHRQTLQFL